MKGTIITRVWRIGRLTLYVQAGHFFVRCVNRTYDHTHEVPADKVQRWYQLVLTGR